MLLQSTVILQQPVTSLNKALTKPQTTCFAFASIFDEFSNFIVGNYDGQRCEYAVGGDNQQSISVRLHVVNSFEFHEQNGCGSSDDSTKTNFSSDPGTNIINHFCTYLLGADVKTNSVELLCYAVDQPFDWLKIVICNGISNQSALFHQSLVMLNYNLSMTLALSVSVT